MADLLKMSADLIDGRVDMREAGRSIGSITSSPNYPLKLQWLRRFHIRSSLRQMTGL